MRIKAGDTIAGQPAIVVRQLFLKTKDRGGDLSDIMQLMHVDEETAEHIFNDLRTEGYIEITEEYTHAAAKDIRWQTTLKGNHLALATARKPIKRKTAERLVKEFLQRVEEINANDDYVYYIQKVLVFGSYLSDSPTLGDVDLAVELVLRHNDEQERRERRDKRVQIALEQGRHFPSFLAQLFWPYTEVLHILKKGSPSISLHDLQQEHLLSTNSVPSQILYEARTKPDS